MIHIVIVSDSYAHFSEAIGEYINRLKGIIEIKSIKSEKSENPVLIKQKESTRILGAISKLKGLVVYCDIASKVLSTEEFTEMIERSKISHPNIIFVVWGAYGIEESILGSFIQKRISFSPMTLPHSLAFLVLLEQVYRAEQIRKNTGYHHA